MHRLAAWVLSIFPLLAQLPPGVSPDLRFEVASVKLAHGDPYTSWVRPSTGYERYEAVNCPISLMLQVAFRIRAEQIVGIPGWLDSQRFDMQAKAEKPSTADELHVMLVNMLVDRMHLKYHREKRDMQMYALVVSKEGAKLVRRESAAGDTWVDLHGHNLQTKMQGINARMDFLAFRLAEELDRPVVDMTGLKGTYDFEVNYTRELPHNFPEGGKLNGEEPDTSGPALFAALKQQIGLELKAEKGPVDVIVIDGAEKLHED
ncbi:MAG TPA: TIGR03435 family protein [Bryobacteraceae bacterium]|nr:TIGR03435 family protein [Bryobacteraceae bacterium]